MRESGIEKAVTLFAKKQGWLSYKFSSPSQRGVPDRMFLQDGVTIFIEFKSAGKKATKLQQHHLSILEGQNFEVHVVDNVEQGKNIFIC